MILLRSQLNRRLLSERRSNQQCNQKQEGRFGGTISMHHRRSLTSIYLNSGKCSCDVLGYFMGAPNAA